MPRVKRGVTARARHKKILAQAKGFRGGGRAFIVSLNRLLLGLVNFRTGIDASKKGPSEHFGSFGLMQVVGTMV